MINIVTASSSNHFKSLCQFLKSVPIEYNTFVYDIGLTQEEAIEIKNTFPNIKYRIFDFSLYPSFVNLSSQDAGAYAWKPIIVSDVYKETSGVLIWCDAGNIITDVNQFNILENLININIIYTAVSSRTVEYFTHPTCLQIMKSDSFINNSTLRNAACVGFKCNNSIAERFLNEWKSYALNKDASLPDGANRDNHRHDQSILSILFYRYQINPIDCYIGYSIHNDIL